MNRDSILISVLTVLVLVLHLFFWQEALQGLILFLFAALLYFLFRIANKTLPAYIMFIAAGAAILDSAGNIYDFYGSYGAYDAWTHAIGTGTVMLFAREILKIFVSESKNRLTFASFLIAVVIGSFYEIAELWIQLIGIKKIWGETDTSLDLQWNTVGALVAVAILFLKDRFSSFRPGKN